MHALPANLDTMLDRPAARMLGAAPIGECTTVVGTP